MYTDNKSLGNFILDGIPPAPRGLPQIEVTFDVDANGILSVKAKDKATNKEQSIRIEASSGLSDADIEKMRKDAEANADSDKQKVELVEVRNQADQTIYGARKALSDNKDKVPAELEKAIDEKITALEGVKAADDIAATRTAIEDLSKELSKVYEAIQKAASTAPAGDAQTPPTGDAPHTDEKPEQPPHAETK